MTVIYLIRHAQAEGNLYRMMQGHWDGGVTQLGRKQIAALAERFKDEKIDAVYSSDLFRTRLTASAILKYHALPLITDERLREVNVGPWETQFFANVAHSEPEALYLFQNDPDKWQIDGAETYKDVQKRAYAALCDIAEQNPDSAVCIASHGVTIRCLVSAVTGRGYTGENLVPIYGNTAVTKIVYENGVFTLEYENDMSHLSGVCATRWNWFGTVRNERFDPKSDRAYYEACYRDAWIFAHGSDEGFSAPAYLHSAEQHYAINPDSVQRIYIEDESAGLIDLDPVRGAEEGYGWISLLYLSEKFRRHKLGIQLLGRVYFFFEQLGRSAVRLCVAEENEAAVAFYKYWGFDVIGKGPGVSGALLLMEKKLGVERME